MKKEINFTRIHQNRKDFLSKYKNKDHVVIEGTNNILISVPHGVAQVRLGKYKHYELGSIATALFLKDNTNSYLIAKTKTNNDDVNFDENSPYKDSIKNLVKVNKVKYILDFHGLSSSRNCDVNLGTHIGINVANNLELFNTLVKTLVDNGFIVSIDQPFMAGRQTIAGSIKKEFDFTWTLQIEINSKITNEIKHFEKFKKLLEIFSEFINSIK